MSKKAKEHLIFFLFLSAASYFLCGPIGILYAAAGHLFGRWASHYMGLLEMKKELDMDSLEEDTIYGPNEEMTVLWGTQAQFTKYYGKYVEAKPLRIMRAATITPDGIIYAVSPPGRHHHSHKAMHELSGLYGSLHHHEEGFVDSEGNFLGREDSVVLARQAKQLFLYGKPKTNPPTELFSEDLW